ncbi:MAG: autotransporter outer membrane beta-barrel domain-containing protein, partial [Acetobacter sp.]|nr:autotransporter outer membrane beta-barrel domain-containing protein [Acetobacter sp.]
DSSYNGDTQCYKCSYKCDTTKGYYGTESLCTAGGYSCTATTENGVSCWKRGSASECPTGYDTAYQSVASCGSSGDKGWTYTSSGTSGGLKCGKCDPKICPNPQETTCTAADSYHTLTVTESTTDFAGNTACKTCTYGCQTGLFTTENECKTDGYTCTERAQNGVSCWERTGSEGCPTDYIANLSDCSAKTHPEGWTYTSTSVGGITCGKCTAKTCTSPFNTTNQTVTSCGNQGSNGWTLNNTTTPKYAGDLLCTQCEKKQCATGTSTSYASSANCPQYTSLTASSAADSSYNGDTQCYKCSYKCDGKDAFEDVRLCTLGSTYTCNAKEINGISCYVRNNTSITTTQNTATLTRVSEGEADVEGLIGDTILENKNNTATGEQALIDITHNSTGTAYGMRGTGSNRLINHENAAIHIQNNAGGTAYGMYTAEGGSAFNRGTITIEGKNGTAIGIYGEGKNTIDNSGTINVSGKDAYGIYVKNGEGSNIFNSGTINVNASNEAHGIYVDKNSTNATVTNAGTIIINNEKKPGDTGITLNGASLRNASVMRFSRAANLNTMDGRVYLEKGGVYEAQSLSGDLNAGTSTVMGANQDTYIAESALKAEDISGLNINSESAMFNASIEKNQNGDGYNITQERKNFAEFAPNQSIANYLEQNYKEGQLENMYNELKSKSDAQALSNETAKKLGYNIMPNFADENFTVLKSLNRNIANTLLKPTEETNRVVAGYDYIDWESDNKGLLSGSDLSANTMYTFGDKRLDNNNRLGLGLSFTKLSSNYEMGGDRDLNIVSIFMPYVHKFAENLHLASVLSVGYGYGEYDRGNDNESDITTFFYGLTNELRYSIDLNGFAELEPALMLNAIGYSDDGYDEGNGESALETRRTRNLSIEAGAGLFLKKNVSTEKYGKFGFKIGGIYYRELGSPYKSIDARMKHGNGSWYRINDYANLYSHDRAILEAAIDYEYKQIGVYLKYNRLIQKNNPELFDLGVKYNF